jgi:hypothetical protein
VFRYWNALEMAMNRPPILHLETLTYPGPKQISIEACSDCQSLFDEIGQIIMVEVVKHRAVSEYERQLIRCPSQIRASVAGPASTKVAEGLFFSFPD